LHGLTAYKCITRSLYARARARIPSAGELARETRARKTDTLLKSLSLSLSLSGSKILGLHILVQRDIAGRVGVLGQLLPEIRREGLRYLVRYT
jgi:hypothetical protein